MSDEQYRNLSTILSDSISDDELIQLVKFHETETLLYPSVLLQFQLQQIEFSSILSELNDYYDKVNLSSSKHRGESKEFHDLDWEICLVRTRISGYLSIGEDSSNEFLLHPRTESNRFVLITTSFCWSSLRQCRTLWKRFLPSSTDGKILFFVFVQESVAMDKLKRKKGFFPLWLGMQEAICGIKPKIDLNSAAESYEDDRMPDLGRWSIHCQRFDGDKVDVF